MNQPDPIFTYCSSCSKEMAYMPYVDHQVIDKPICNRCKEKAKLK